MIKATFFIFLIILNYYFLLKQDKINNYEIEEIITNLNSPWSLVFDEKGRLFFTERPGYVKVYENGEIKEIKINLTVYFDTTSGLLGLALDPNFTKNNFVYIYYSYKEENRIFNRVVKYKFINYTLVEVKILVDKIPGSRLHNGGRIKFGPDNKLYITTGDAENKTSAQDLNSLAGKILRINPDGKVPKDNPFNNLIYSYGHRNPQGLAWNPETKDLFITEHGPIGHDEINLIIKGKNYGWPVVTGYSNETNFVNPLIDTGNETWAPSGAVFYEGDKFPELKNSLLVATLRGEHLRVIEFEKGNGYKVKKSYALFKNVFGRIRDIAIDNEGYIYLATNNKVGGKIREGDDKIVKIIPKVISKDNLLFYIFIVITVFLLLIFLIKKLRIKKY